MLCTRKPSLSTTSVQHKPHPCIFVCLLVFYVVFFFIELPVKGTVWFGNISVLLILGWVVFLKPRADVCCWLFVVFLFFFFPPIFSLLKSPPVVPERGMTLLFFCAEPLLQGSTHPRPRGFQSVCFCLRLVVQTPSPGCEPAAAPLCPRHFSADQGFFSAQKAISSPRWGISIASP